MSTRGQIGVGCLILGLGVGLGYLLCSAGATRIRITGPEGSAIEIDSNDDYLGVLEEIYNHELLRGGMKEWLAGKSTFEIQDPRLVRALRNDLCDPVPDTRSSMDSLMEDGRKCADVPVAKGLRDLAEEKVAPFHYLGSEVRIGKQVEDLHRPRDGYANACREGYFYGRTVQIRNKINPSRSVKVQALNPYPCPPGTEADIQLNENDMAKLFPGPVDKTEEAYAFVL